MSHRMETDETGRKIQSRTNALKDRNSKEDQKAKQAKHRSLAPGVTTKR